MSDIERFCGPGFTGRTRRRWFFFTQYEYALRVFTGMKCSNPDGWPIECRWSYQKPRALSQNSVGLIDAWRGS